MKINRDKHKGFQYLDENNIILSNSYSQGIGDSLGRTAIGAVIYDEDRLSLIEGIFSNIRYLRTSPETGSHFYFSRYPVGEEWAAVGSSRDHVVYTIASLKMIAGDDEMSDDNILIKSILANKSKRPCVDHPYTLDQKVWFKALYSKGWSNVLSFMMSTYMRLIQALKWVWRKLGQRGDDILPTYAVFYFLWSIQAIKGNWAKRVLKKVLRAHFEDSNLVARMLCDEYVSKAEVDDYVPTRKNRWTTRVDGESDRDLTLYPQDTPEDNVELGLLVYLYENQTKQI